jgi:nicotinate-nucleotide adenylyltransferase
MGRRIGILGGTFDPIHNGHLIIGQEMVWRLGLERVLLVPSADPPHKAYPEMASAEARVEMVRMAVADTPAFELSLIEQERPGKSYTVDTLRDLRAQMDAETEFSLLLGADSAQDMRTWCDPEGVVRLARIVVVDRPGFDRSAIDPTLSQHMDVVEAPLLEISSTDIRSRVRSGRPIRYLVPDEVARFIERQGLYRQG